MIEFLKNGQLSDCPAPQGVCNCESSLYKTTGVLALTAGLAQWAVGYHYSMAVLSDALHAMADASADFVGMFIAKKVVNNPPKAKELRSIGNKIIALLLVLGALTIGIEAYGRWQGGDYVVWLPAVVLVGLFGLVIDLARFRMLSKARGHISNSNLSGLMEHARSDAWHSGIISAIALLAILGSFLSIENGLYAFFVRLVDYLASLGLAGYMACILTPRVWKGVGCGYAHTHGSKCAHKH